MTDSVTGARWYEQNWAGFMNLNVILHVHFLKKSQIQIQIDS